MAPRHGGGGGKLIQGLVLSAASIGGTLAVWSELHLEFDEVVLLVWTVVLPLWAIIALILPVLRKSADLRLYLFLLVVCPAVLLYFFSGHLTMDEAVLIALCVAPVVSTVRMVQSSLKRSLPDWNYHFWAERLLRNYTGVREENEMWWGLMVANTNKVCGFGMELCAGLLRLCSLPVWFLLWNGDYLAGGSGGRAQGYEMVKAHRETAEGGGF